MKARLRLGMVAAALMVLVSACGQSADSPDAGAAPQTPIPTATGSAPASGRLDKITAACPLLPSADVVRVLGGDSNSTLEATEGKMETPAGGARFTCTYGRGGKQALVLAVGEAAGQPTAGVEAVAEESGAEAKDVPGLGDAAVTYTAQGFRYVVTAVSAEQGHRLVFVGAAEIVPQDRLTELAGAVVHAI